MTRTNVYIDGFNLYYGMLKDSADKWLDLQKLFGYLRADDDIGTIKYFTALVDGSHQLHQLTYLRALGTTPNIRIIQGKFKAKSIRCGVEKCRHNGTRYFKVPEEKRTDVNIAIELLDDAYQDEADCFVIVSGDSDLVPAVKKLKLRYPSKQVVVYVPARDKTRGAATELRGSADKHKTLPKVLLQRSQFPDEIELPGGTLIKKPASWD